MERETTETAGGFGAAEAGGATGATGATGGTAGATGATGAGAFGGTGQDYSQAAQRLSGALADLDRRYGVSETIRAHPWPALAVAAGVGFALAETSLDQGAGTATSQATRGLKSSAGTLVDTLAAAATTTVTEALRGHLDGLVADLKQAIGAPTPPRA